MGYDAVHTASSTGDDQEIRRCIEGLDADRDGLFNRHDPQPRVVVGRTPGSHGRFNKPIPAAIRGSLGDTPLHKAAMAGQTVCLGYLLSIAASGGLTTPVDGMPEHRTEGNDAVRAHAHGQQAELEQAEEVGVGDRQTAPVADRPMDVLAKLVGAINDAGQTALHLAALHGNYSCVQMLLAAKSDVQATDAASGMTPLHAAVRMGHLRCVILLLDAMADPNAPDLQGGSALHIAARHNVSGVVRVLAGAGGMLDGQRSQDLYTPLHLACRYNMTPDTVLALLDARADPSLMSRAGQPPALIAATLGDESVLEVVSEAHWRLCLENPDGEGLSRIKGGGNLTCRALFDKAMQRQCWELSLPNSEGKWYDPNFETLHEWRSENGELSMSISPSKPGVASGRWVALGPLTDEDLNKAVSHAFGEALEVLNLKVGSYTPLDKMQQLVTIELSAPTRTLRTANDHWWRGRRARQAFDFAEAERAFKAAAKVFASDWWGADGADGATTLALEMMELRELKDSLDGKMEAGDRHRKHFEFRDAIECYKGVGEAFASYGHTDRAFEALSRLEEVEKKALLREEAEACVAKAKEDCVTATPLPEYPHSRLMLKEAVSHLTRACKLYKSYGDSASYQTTKNRLTAAQWNLDKQGKAYLHLVAGNRLMSWEALGLGYERKPDTTVVYAPSETYQFDDHTPSVLMMLRIEEGVAEFRSAIQYLADIGDEEVHSLAAANQAEAERLLAIQTDAHVHLQKGQETETHFAVDTQMEGKVVVFGQVPTEADAKTLCIPGRVPYRSHAEANDYPLHEMQGAQRGAIYHRKKLREGMEAFRHAKECFEQLPDEANRLEAERQELRLLERLRLQNEANRLFADAHACVLGRQYADASEKFKQACLRLGKIDDPRNAEYLQQLCNDAAEKRRLADLAHSKMRQGQELLEKREAFARWEDVVDVGLEAFAEAETLFKDAGDLFTDLDQHDNAGKANERQVESFERKTHAEELQASCVIVVQPTGDYAPQRRDPWRRTMGYDTAVQALQDAATDGYTSTYHTRAEILEGSTVYLRKGVHEFVRTIQVNRDVGIRAEDGLVADDCEMLIKIVSLLSSQAANVSLADVTLRQLLGDGAEDYWSGGLYVIMVTQGYLQADSCFVYSQRGCGVVARHSGKVLLTKTIVDGCGQYGVAADGADAIVDLRDCTIDASKFENTDQRNGGRVIGFIEED